MLEPTLKQYLPEAISKLAGYYSATFKLVCAARDKTCCVFQNVRVEPFQIQQTRSNVAWQIWKIWHKARGVSLKALWIFT